MKKLALGILCAGILVVTGCGGGDGKPHITLDAGSGTGTCDPLKQTGCAANEKCTWLVDAIAPNYVGHVGCAPAGTAAIGESCKYMGQGTNGYDNCSKGLVCGGGWSPVRGGHCTGGTRACTKNSDCSAGEDCGDNNFCGKRCAGDTECDAGATCTYRVGPICKTICDPLAAAGNATCDTSHQCGTYVALFSTGDTTPAAAGVCDSKCDPLADNDFDGAGPLTKRATTCSTGEGCYGSPDGGSEPATRFTCTADFSANIAQPTGLRHRVQCIEDNRCIDAPGQTPHTNSCNQGYIPLFYESSSVTTVVCTAMCKPVTCSLGNCGASNDINRLGNQPDRCNTQDRIAGPAGFYQGNPNDVHPNGEHCQFLWFHEIDSMSGMYVPSDLKDAVGYCFDHSKYPYDSNGDGSLDADLPPCAALPITATGSDKTMPLTYFGAKNLGCVTSDEAGVNMANGKAHIIPAADLERLRLLNLPRPPYHSSSF